MEPFLIQCDSCHAKLKVAKASLIGKRLPCPKCKTILIVSASPDKTAAEGTSIGRPQDVPPEPEEAMGGFEDVDQLLAQLPTAKKHPLSTKSKPSRKSKQEPGVNRESGVRPKPSAGPNPKSKQASRRVPKPEPDRAVESSVADEPIAPDLAWDNPAATQTRRVLSWVAAAVGVILFIAIGCYAWFSYQPSAAPAKKVAAAEGVAAAKNDPTEPALADASSTDLTPAAPDRVTDATVDDTQVAMKNRDDTASRPNASGAGGPPLGQTDPDANALGSARSIVDSTPPPIDFPAAVDSGDKTGGLVATSPVLGSIPNASDVPAAPVAEPNPLTSSDSGSHEVLRPVAPARSALSELSALLENSGSSISAITDATAAVSATDTIGLPKYFFQEARSARVDIERQLKQPCIGLRYQDVPLIDILRDVTLISGIPITIDTLSVAHANQADRLIPKVSVDISDTDFETAIGQIAQQVGWTARTTATGVLLTDPNAGNVVKKVIDLGLISELGEEGLDGVTDGIKAMIASESWFANADQFQISRAGTSLSVNHAPSVVNRVERFIDKISNSMRLGDGDSSNDETLNGKLDTRLTLASKNLSASCELAIDSRKTLDHLLNRIHRKTGVDIIANWETLATLGWDPLMTVPGNVSEPTLDEMVRQLERSMGSTAIVLDAHTIELTTPIDATQHSYVEFYLISHLFNQNFTPERTLQLVQEAIDNTVQAVATTTVYEPRCRCIILAAPQSTHRVVEAVLQELRQLK